MNASFRSIRAGLRPVVQQDLDGVEYFRFRNGQVRRQIGHGHSSEERAQRRAAKRERSRRIKLGNHFLDLGLVSGQVGDLEFSNVPATISF